MKLRNKKTGEIEAVQHNVALLHFSSGKTSAYHSLAELNDEWEDYTTSEPLIKDEKIRKAVRAWAELHKLENVFYFEYSIREELSYLKSNDTGVVIDIVALPELKDGKIYTIAELCGEEEE